MSDTCWLVRAAFSAAVIWFLGAPTFSSVEASKPAEAMIEKGLSRKITVKFIEAPLDDVAALLGEEVGINVVLDRDALREARVPGDTPVTLSVKDVPFRSVLEKLSRTFDLDWAVRNEVLLVTTRARSGSVLSTKIYPVGDLIVRRDESGNLTRDAESLVKIITRCIDPETWHEAGGRGSIAPAPLGDRTTLVVRQTRRVQQQVVDLLARLRDIRRKPAAGKPDDESPTEATYKALSRRVTLEFDHAPLADVVRFLKDRCGVNIVLDTEALRGVNLSPDTRVSIRGKDVSLRWALRWMLRKLDLEFQIQGEILLITTPEVAWAARGLSLKVYPVGDVIALHDESGRLTYHFDALAKILLDCIQPHTWGDLGGPGALAVAPFENVHALVVLETLEVHEEIAQLLATLRKIARDTAAGTTAVCYGRRWQPTPAEKAILKALSQEVTLDFNEKPLREVARLMSKSCGVNVLLDQKGLDDVGIGGDTPVTIRVKDVSLRSALRLMLRDFDLTYVIQDDCLLITPPEEAEARMNLKLYPVGDLVARHDDSGRVRYDFDALAEIVLRCIGPRTWEKVGGPGAIRCARFDNVQVLAISQYAHVHEDVVELLTTLRNIAQDSAAGRTAVRYGSYWEDTPAKKRIQKALSQKVTVDFDEKPLLDVARSLSESCGINIFLDRRAFNDLGIGADIPVTFGVSGISLRSALRLMLRDLELTWVIQDEVLLITTPAEAEFCIVLGCYPVGNLVAPRHKSGRITYELAWLTDLTATMIHPTTWHEVGGAGSLAMADLQNVQALVFAQNPETHEKIARFLAALRKATRQASHGKKTQEVIDCDRNPADADAEQAIGKALAGKVSLEFEETPLIDVVAQLREVAKINILLDHRGLEDVGISPDTPVSLRVSEVTLRSALELLFDERDLAWTIHQGALWITTAQDIEYALATKIYPVPDLVVCRDESGELWDDYQTIIDIVRTIRPATWERGWASVRGASFGKAKVLAVTQAGPAHRQIAQLLKELRAVARSRPDVGKPPLRKRPPKPTPKPSKRIGGGFF